MSQVVITNNGKTLVENNETVRVVRVAVGSGSPAESADPSTFTSLVSYKMDSIISKCGVAENIMKVVVQLVNAPGDTGFLATELGVYLSQDSDTASEVLYGYVDMSQDPQYVYTEAEGTQKVTEITIEILMRDGVQVNSEINVDSLVFRDDLAQSAYTGKLDDTDTTFTKRPIIKNGFYSTVMSANGNGTVDSNKRYMKFLELTIGNNYCDTPIEITISHRGSGELIYISLMFEASTFNALWYHHKNVKDTLYLHRVVGTTNVWDVYILMSEAYDSVAVHDIKYDSSLIPNLSITFPGTLVDNAPTDALAIPYRVMASLDSSGRDIKGLFDSMSPVAYSGKLDDTDGVFSNHPVLKNGFSVSTVEVSDTTKKYVRFLDIVFNDSSNPYLNSPIEITVGIMGTLSLARIYLLFKLDSNGEIVIDKSGYNSDTNYGFYTRRYGSASPTNTKYTLYMALAGSKTINVYDIKISDKLLANTTFNHLKVAVDSSGGATQIPAIGRAITNKYGKDIADYYLPKYLNWDIKLTGSDNSYDFTNDFSMLRLISAIENPNLPSGKYILHSMDFPEPILTLGDAIDIPIVYPDTPDTPVANVRIVSGATYFSITLTIPSGSVFNIAVYVYIIPYI